MKILDLTIHGFGKFHEEKISFNSGINIIFGRNEAGKSTVHTFIRSMLFGMNTKSLNPDIRDNYLRYEPWTDLGMYEGEMRVNFENKTWKIKRNFRKSQESLVIICEDNNQVVEKPTKLLNKMLFGMTEASYINTVSIGQLKASTEEGMSNELKRYIQNLNTSGNISINTANAFKYLKNKKTELEKKIVQDATVQYTTILHNIAELENSIQVPVYDKHFSEINNLKEKDKIRTNEYDSQLEELESRRDTLKQMLNKNGFEIKRDITDLRYSTAKNYSQYKDLLDKENNIASSFARVFSIVLGILLLLAHTFIIYSLYPSILGDGEVHGFFAAISPFITSVNGLNVGFTIFVYLLGFALLVYGIATTLKHFDRKATIFDIVENLKEVYMQQINTDAVDDQSFNQFNYHLDKMERLYYQKEDCDDKIQVLQSEKLKLTDNGKKYLEEIQNIQKAQYDLDMNLKNISDLKDKSEALKKIIQNNDEINKEIAAINLSIETISELSSKIKASFGAYLNREASGLLSGITNGLYNSISIGDNQEVYLNTAGKAVPMDQVSSGTMDQIYLTIRLASASLIMGNSNERLPLLFDDSFVMYDDERLASVLYWLANNVNTQILIFTCHTREQNIASQLNIAHTNVDF